MKIAVIGAGAFGSALAMALDDATRQITLIGRDETLATTRQPARLPDVTLPNTIAVSTAVDHAAAADVVLLATPTQTLGHLLTANAAVFQGKPLVACCKGIDLTQLIGPADLIAATLPSATPAILTGPSFAVDIARGLPTALTIACADTAIGTQLQAALSSATLRLYRTKDITGAQLGGALKNVIAIACGATIGAGYGDSARAAILTRGFSEMQRLAHHLGANPETLNGLSGLGDLALTCTSDLSRNYRFGLALGSGATWDSSTTVEGASTAKAAAQISAAQGIDLPITQTTAALAMGEITVDTALTKLLSRPLRDE